MLRSVHLGYTRQTRLARTASISTVTSQAEVQMYQSASAKSSPWLVQLCDQASCLSWTKVRNASVLFQWPHTDRATATSAIDHDTDTIIQNTLRRELGSDVTVLTIAHRLQTIIDADRVVRGCFIDTFAWVLIGRSACPRRWENC